MATSISTLAADESLPIGTTSGEQGYTWMVVAQAESVNIEESDQPVFSSEEIIKIDPIDFIVGTIYTDRSGNEWELIDIDSDMLINLVESEKIVDIHDSQSLLRDPLAVTTRVEDSGVNHLLSWKGYDCETSRPGNELFNYWDPASGITAETADDRIKISFANGPKTSAVWVITDDGSHTKFSVKEECSGVLIGNSWVLTAAHCITDSDYVSPLNPSQVGVCLYGNSPLTTPINAVTPLCTRSDAIFLNGSWGNAWLSKHYAWADFALIKLPEGYSFGLWDGVTPMTLSQVTDPESIESNTYYNASYPGYVNGGGMHSEPRSDGPSRPLDVRQLQPKKLGSHVSRRCPG